MSKLPWKKNLHLCLPSFKCLPLIPNPSDQDQDQDQDHPSLIIINKLNTLYHDSNSSDQSTSKSLTASFDFFYSSSSDSDAAAPDSPPDFATVFASQRFFFSSPGRSNSIVESPDTKPSNKDDSFVTRGVTVSKYSSNPYLDFRKSMEEMLEARDHTSTNNSKDRDDHHNGVEVLKSDVDYLHELLLCYLQLNPEDAHKDIISAFTDLVICTLSANPTASRSAPADDNEIRRQRPS